MFVLHSASWNLSAQGTFLSQMEKN